MIHGVDIESERFIGEWNNDSPTIIAHTSGSTGSPKEISLLKSDMRISAIATCNFFNITGSTTLVCPLSASYIAGKMMIVRAMVSGATLYMERPSNRPLSTIKEDAQIDFVCIVPSQIQGLIEASKNHIIKSVIIGGAPIPPALEKMLYDAPFKSYATYGMTETCSHVALRLIAPGNQVFTALQGYTFSTDSRSCLVIESDSQSFHKIVTNDIVNLIDSSHFQWLGRYDNVIISGGIKIFPEKIEEAISHLLPVRFYITGRCDDKWGHHVTLVIESEPFDYAELLEKISTIIKPHEKPREVIFRRVFDVTSSGKIIRT